MARRLAALLLAGALAGCGFAVARGATLRGGARRVEVGTLENRSGDPSVGAAVTGALRRELQRRGAATGPGPAARLEGEVRTASAGAGLPGGATQRVALEVRARLLVDGRTVAEPVIRREADALIGADGLEGQARRAHALARLADEVARALLDALEE